MSCNARRLFALGPKLAALLVLIAALLAAPLSLPAAPETCCCPVPAKCTCAEHRAANHGTSSIRRCSQPVPQVAPLPAPIAALPPALALAAPLAVAPPPVRPLPSPHASPDRERPRAPG